MKILPIHDVSAIGLKLEGVDGLSMAELFPSSLIPAVSLSLSLSSHYFVHGGWFPTNNYLLDKIDTIRHIPATIVQGRYDVVTPMKMAWELHKVLHCLLLIVF